MISPGDTFLSERFDCVLMLTWSDWRTEMRSNRYHFATRFARHLPVLFVQPDLPVPGYSFDSTEVDGVEVLHVFAEYGPRQDRLLNEALLERGRLQPLLWIYNYEFLSFILSRAAPLAVYHATEDYFCSDFMTIARPQKLREAIAAVDLLVAVSDGVRDSYVRRGRYPGEVLVLANGCDYAFWSKARARRSRPTDNRAPVALYQGGISHKLDWPLLHSLVATLPDWEFWFCGEVFNCHDDWRRLARRPNVHSFRKLPIEEVRELAGQATVGLIPFVHNEWIIERSYPLKAFEYIAADLPVVSAPVKSLLPFGDLFHFASDADAFARAIREAALTRDDPESSRRRAEAAKSKDYDITFRKLATRLSDLNEPRCRPSLNGLILYDDRSMHVNTIAEHLNSFSAHSRHRFSYAVATGDARCDVDLSVVDLIVIHYSVRVSIEDHLSPDWVDALRRFGGYKVLFAQDEYDTTETTRRWIERLGVHLVFTCVPTPYIQEVYPSDRFPRVAFHPTLTGYVPARFETDASRKPLRERTIMIGYRGRPLPFWYGALGQEKIEIGRRMKAICAARGVEADIEWDDAHRIYGEDWYGFIENCRAMIGSESGANVFDDTGAIRRAIERAQAANPDLTFDEAYERFLKPHEGRVRMNQISPKIFEAIAMRTALILFEGDYSGVIEPHVHYIPLKKDFSNIDDVLEQLHDEDFVEEMTSRAHQDVIASGRYGYGAFIQDFDAVVDSRTRSRAPAQLLHVQLSGRRSGEEGRPVAVLNADARLRDMITSRPLMPDEAEDGVAIARASRRGAPAVKSRLERIGYRLMTTVWTRMPRPLKPIVKTVLRPFKPLLVRLLRA